MSVRRFFRTTPAERKPRAAFRSHPTDVRSHQARHRHGDILLLDHALDHARRASHRHRRPRWTLIGKLGTIVGRNQIGFVDIPDGLAVFTGTWKVIRGTCAYAGLSGGGRVAGVQFASGTAKAQYQGFLGPK
jgi:hypothetical protein